MTTAPSRKLAPAPIVRASALDARPLARPGAAATPSYVAALRALKLVLLIAPIGVAAACATTETRYAGAAPPVRPEPYPTDSSAARGASTTAPASLSTIAPPPAPTSPPIAPSEVAPPAAGGARPTMPGIE